MRAISIVPAYNEEENIGIVLQTLKEVSLIDEIVVVSDGSTDNTVEVANSYGVNVIDLEENKGKGGAMKVGLERVKADVILFLDADLIGLKKEHVHNLLEPVISEEAQMSIGIFEKGRMATDLAQKVAPYLSGQRAVRSSLLEKVSDLDVSRFGVEVSLTRLVEREKLKVKEVILKDMSHVMKEEKLGVVKGLAARMKMYWEIVKYFAKNEYSKQD